MDQLCYGSSVPFYQLKHKQDNLNSLIVSLISLGPPEVHFYLGGKKFAVASPDYISEHGPLDDLANPKQHRLIDCRRGSKDLDVLCVLREDAVASNYPGLEQQLIILPDDYPAYNATIHGRGIALSPIYLTGNDIKAGNIVYANSQPISFRGSYYFVSPTGVRPNSNLDAFRDWLVEISEEFRSAENFREKRFLRSIFCIVSLICVTKCE